MLFTTEDLSLVTGYPISTIYHAMQHNRLTPQQSGTRGRWLGCRFSLSQLFELTMHAATGGKMRDCKIGRCDSLEYEAQDRDLLHFFLTGENLPHVQERAPWLTLTEEQLQHPAMKRWAEMVERLKKLIRKKDSGAPTTAK